MIEFGELAELGIGKVAARIARIGFEEFDRHLALRARPVDMRGLAADISDQTCKTAAQSRTRFVGHRQLPWIHVSALQDCNVDFRSEREAGRSAAHLVLRDSDARGRTARRGGAPLPHPDGDAAYQCARSSRSRWITSVASLR